MNLTELATLVRNLIGVFSKDVLSDDLLYRWINETYYSVHRYTTWPWSVATLVAGPPATSPSFDSQFHQILAYGAAVKALGFVSDDTNRAQFYTQEYQNLLAEMDRYYTSAAAPGTVSNLVQIARTARDLTGVYDTKVVSDALMYLWVNEAYFAVARYTTWPWTATTLVATPTPTAPTFDAQFHPILAYGAAVRTLSFIADDTNKGQMYQAKYDAILADMDKFYTSANGTGTFGNFAQMVRTVRDITGAFDITVVPDTLVKLYINQAYNELIQAREWDWMEATHSAAIPAFASGAHTVTLSNGTRRVLEAVLVSPNGDVETMQQVPTVIDILKTDKPCYDVSATGVVSIVPEQPADRTVKIRYIQSTASLSTNTDVPAFDAKYAMILVYRAAVNVMSHLDPKDPRVDLFFREYSSILESMVSVYEEDHDYTSIQFGGGLAPDRRYFPWFRPS